MEVRAAIELSFEVVSGVTPGIHVLYAGPRASKGRVSNILGSFAFIGLVVSMAYFVTEMYSTHT